MAAEEGGVEGGVVIACHTKRDLEANMTKGHETGKLVIIEFTASWSDACLVMAPMFVKYAKMYPDTIFLTVDVDEPKPVAAEFAVQELPTFVFIRRGEHIFTTAGLNEEDMYSLLAAYAT